ncbi:MAG: hypothetical protein DUD27_06805 [Lachnospiraceae bacterium]|uniref:Cyclic nucleotide-binding domain-containing protein n=1 Tax=Candidatus Weimeria bifida TaxID=2599074 RepID=A0A6N7J106_9FIRM|nr:hypothetical protein [Candidatus Weimeria bifida]RRF95976.1 MAG: hypothetical protein DUD27_06805 [Lachnospiraceae bacterium]
MGLEKWEKDSEIINKDDSVKSLLILLKGTVQLQMSDIVFDVNPGSIIGIGSEPGETYGFSCVAKTAAATYSYDFNSLEDVIQIFTDNPKIAPAMCEAVLKNAYNIYTSLEQKLETSLGMYKNVKEKLEEYPVLCRRTGDKILDFIMLKAFPAPPEETGIESWRVNFLKALLSFEGRKDELLMGQPDLCMGYTCFAIEFIHDVKAKVAEFSKYTDDLRQASGEFLIVYSAVSAKSSAIETGDAGMMPPMENLLDQILMFSKASEKDAAELKACMQEYEALNDRYGVSDEHRKIRRRLTKAFYPVYEAVLLQVFKKKIEPPVIIKMFLMFGLLDEKIVTKDELQTLYGFAKSYRPDPEGHVMCAWEWLRKIYNLEVDPSRNEFDLDYPTYLRELKNHGDIDDEQEQKILKSPRRRLHFELSNMFTMGNRMTFGRMASFEPAFDDVNVIGSMEKGYLYTEKLEKELSYVTDRDYSIFYRNDIYSAPEFNVQQLAIHRQFMPNFILMPNMGSRFVLWQEIEGKRRQSSARMLVPIIMSENISDNIAKLCGEFRWEMCKTEQGIHWNDMRDPSLTAEYNDYLQFFKKNSAFTSDIKEKIKSELKKHNNNFKMVFVADYHDYILYESNGSMRLLKPAREILAKYCPFTGDSKALLATNPTYQQYIERFNNHEKKDHRIVELTIKRFEKNGTSVPDELKAEEEYLSH